LTGGKMAERFELDERSKQILEAVVNCYIATAEPVGSRTISRKYNFKLSPASIRNIMADLEEMGYLKHPHTSAGRLPTEKGYRFYVQCLKTLPLQSEKYIADFYDGYGQGIEELDQLLRQASRLLSMKTSYIGVVLAPRMRQMIFKHIDFVHLRDNLILVIFVSRSGLVHQKIIHVSESYTQEKLDQMTRCLNEHFKDMALSQIRSKLLEMMSHDKLLYDKLLKRALMLSEELFYSEEESKVYIDGQLNIFNQPEFSDLDKMKAIFAAFEEKSQLINLLDKCLADKGLQILIGSENQIEEMRDCSFITTTYNVGNSVMGALGVIGPTRMEYSNVIPLVESTALMVSQMLSKL
jgi:heat-inducible transcriptional repressor